MSKKNIKSVLYGYRYQSLIGILRLIDLLNDKADKVSFEKKESNNDRFDDIKVYVKNQIHHCQIKSSYVNNELKIVDFSSKHILDLSKLFDSWKELQKKFTDKEMFYHVYTTKSVSPNNPLKNFVKKATANKTTFCENRSDVYHLKLEILDHDHLKKIKNSFTADAIDNADIQKFLDVLIIETDQPSNPPEIPIAMSTHGELETIIRNKISNLGLNQQPNRIPDDRVFASLLNLVDRDSTAPHEITKGDLEDYLNVVQNFGAIKNHIEFDESLYVDTTENLAQLNEQAVQNAGGILGITGKPGSGKTWLLTRWLKEFHSTNQDTPPIWYYSSISVTNDSDFETRVTRYQIIRNLVDAIKTSYYITTENNRYAANDASLKELLYKLNEIAKEKQTVIPIVVDGLDHVDRIKERAITIKRQEETVMDFLNEIDIPSHICFVFGSQEGAHLDKLKEKFGCEKFYEIHGFSESETGSYLHKLKVSIELITTENTSLIFQKTSGLPLLVSYLGQQLKTGADIEEKIKNIPMTEGNVKKYYEYLWKNLGNCVYPRIFAKYFSLLEFPIDTEFLECLKPRNQRDGEELGACIKPLIFLLRENQKNEMSIFHDSFREFILKETGFEDSLQIQYSKDIYDALLREDIILNTRTFRYALKYALKSKRFDEIISLVTLEFTDKAMINLCNRYDLRNNLLYAIRAASEKENAITLLEKSLLKRYTMERYQYLENDRFNKLIIRIHPDKLSQILLTEDQLNLPLHDTVRFLGEGLSKKIELPYNNIIKIWNNALNKTTWGKKGRLPEHISLPDYGVLLFYKNGIKTVASWVSQNPFSLEQTISIFKKIFLLSTYDDILQLRNSSDANEYWPTLRLFAAFHYKKHDQFKIQFEEFMKSDSIPYFSEFGEFLKKSTIPPENFAHLIHRVHLSPPAHGSIVLESFHEYEQQILLNAYCKNITCLEEYETEIRQNPTVFFYKIVSLAYHVSKLSQKPDSRLTCADANKLLNSLSEFINHDTKRSFDEPGYHDRNFQPYMCRIIEKAVKIIVTQDNPNIKTKLVETVSKIATKLSYTSLTLDNTYEMILKHTNDSIFKQLLAGKISDELDMVETQIMVEQCFDKSRLYLQTRDKNMAKEFFEKGILLTFSYGYHKDLFLWEIHRISVLLGKNNYLQRAKSCLDMTEYLDVITDGDETRSIPFEIINDTMNMHSDAGYEIALKYGVDSYEFEKSVIDFVESCSHCSVLIRYFLAKTTIVESHTNSHTSSTAFETRCKLIQECISKNHTALAKLLLNDLRVETMRDLPEKTKSMEKKFNCLAEILGLDIIELNLNEVPKNAQENYPDEIVDYSHLSPEEAIRLFEGHYGWSWGHSKSADRLLEIAYLKDKEKTDRLITKSLLHWCLNYDSEPQGAIHRFGKYLSITNQVEKLNAFYQRMDLFSKDLFRGYCLETKHDFQFLETHVHEDDQTRTGCKYIVKQLTSRDTEVQRRAFTSTVNCIKHGSTELLGYCIEAVMDSGTDTSLKAKLAAVIHSCAVSRKDASEQIISCAQYLCQANDRRLVTSGTGILRELEVSYH